MKSLVLASLLLALPTSGAAERLSLAGIDGRGKLVQLADHVGKVVIVTFFSQFTRWEAERVNDQVEHRAPRIGVSLLSVFDMAGIPASLQDYARSRMAKATAGRRFHFIVDNSGRCSSAAAANPAGRVDILVVDRAGNLLGHFVGEKRVAEALELAERLSADPPTTASR